MGYGITDPSQMIDVASINTYCNYMRGYLPSLTSIGQLIEDAGNICDENALRIDNLTMKPQLVEYGESVKNLNTQFASALDQICEDAAEIRAEQEREYYAWLEEQQRIRQCQFEEEEEGEEYGNRSL